MSFLEDYVLATRPGFYAYMAARWGVGQRAVPQADWMNTALLNQAQVDQAAAEARRLRLPPFPGADKNWDTLAALREVVSRTTPSAHVLDAGAEIYSRILPWLYLYGYRNLIGNNLVFTETIHRGPIVYEPGDITKLRFPDRTFDAVTCLSVVEHGVDVEAYFKEMARVLKPGGLLVTSTDYFESATDTKGLSAYGVPIRVFTADDVTAMVEVAKRYDLHLTKPIDTRSQDRVVRWDQFGLQYTFIVFSMVKGGRPAA
jgi:SAM-dependent methyltransferase